VEAIGTSNVLSLLLRLSIVVLARKGRTIKIDDSSDPEFDCYCEGLTIEHKTFSGKCMSTLTFGFVIVPNFSLIALSACVDPLRLANQVMGRPIYKTVLLSLDGGLVAFW
jgi:hypothetical protein